MNKGEFETRMVLRHMFEQDIINEREFNDLNSVIDEDGTFAAQAGISSVVQYNPNNIPKELLDEILALKPVFDEEYYADRLDALAERS